MGNIVPKSSPNTERYVSESVGFVGSSCQLFWPNHMHTKYSNGWVKTPVTIGQDVSVKESKCQPLIFGSIG